MPDNPVVLVIDDNRPDLYLFRIALYNSGIPYLAVITDDGTTAMQKCRAAGFDPNITVPDLILLDLNLGSCSGFHVLEAIRANTHLDSTSVVIVSGSDREDDISRCYALNANAYMFKNIGIDELFRSVKNATTFFFRFRCHRSAENVVF